MNIYFVYIYRDPLTDVPFYVGYGKNSRHLSHLREAISNPIPVSGEGKLNKIRKLLRQGMSPIIQIIKDNLTKEEACELETFFISKIGRADLGTGPLTNLTAGGDGNREWTPDCRKKLSKRSKNMIMARDSDGNTFRVRKDDPRWTSGELVGINSGRLGITNKNGSLTGYIMAKDSDGNTFRVRKDDPRWTSGELVGINKGKPPHPNVIAAGKKRKGIPNTKEQNQKVSESLKQLKWYCNFETDTVKRYKEGHEPHGFVRVSGPHKRERI